MSTQHAPDITQQEKAAGQKAAKALSRKLKLVLATSIKPSTPSVMLKAVGASAVIKYGVLDHIAIRSTSAMFKQHYGFEGIKKNGVHMSMKPFHHIDNLFSGKILDNLIDEIGGIRAEEVASVIRF